MRSRPTIAARLFGIPFPSPALFETLPACPPLFVRSPLSLAEFSCDMSSNLSTFEPGDATFDSALASSSEISCLRAGRVI